MGFFLIMSSIGRFLQFLLVHALGDMTVVPTHHQLETYTDNLPQETNKSPLGSGLEEAKAASPTAAVSMLLSKTPAIEMASITPTNFRRHLWGWFITWFLNRAKCELTTPPFCAWTCSPRSPAWSQAPLGRLPGQGWLSVKESTFQMVTINSYFPD